MGEKRHAFRPDYAVPPGDTVLEVLRSLGMTQAELAGRTGRPRKTINEIIKGKAAITAETAIQFEMVLGVPASMWLGLERDYQETIARTKESRELALAKGWLDGLPVRKMVEYGWLEDRGDPAGKVREALSFFGVASPEAWQVVWTAPDAALRESKAFQSQPGAVAAWLRRGEIEARRIECRPHSSRLFRETLRRVRSLTRGSVDGIEKSLASLCAEAGVAVVFVPELPGARLSGATRWLAPDKALVQLSLRYRTDDQLWFTFFHEGAHILLHGKEARIEEEDGASGEEEEASRFAADFLIPPKQYRAFTCAHRRPTKRAVASFAADLGIAPGIVVGRLQHDGFVPWGHLNGLKRKLTWA